MKAKRVSLSQVRTNSVGDTMVEERTLEEQIVDRLIRSYFNVPALLPLGQC